MGAKRGQRNRDQDRYWHERRKAKQGGMVGAADVSCCVFCGNLTSLETTVRSCSEVVCIPCGQSRGLFDEPINIRSNSDVGILQAAEFIGGFSDNSGGPGGRAKAHFVGGCIDGGRGSWIKTDKAQPMAAERARLYARALLWLSRDTTIDASSFAYEAQSIVGMPIAEARQAIKALRWEVYRQQHRPRETVPYSKLSADQVVAIRERYAAGGYSFKSLGREYGVSGGTVSQIVTGSTFRKIGGPVYWPNRGWFPDAETAYRRCSLGWTLTADGMASA